MVSLHVCEEDCAWIFDFGVGKLEGSTRDKVFELELNLSYELIFAVFFPVPDLQSKSM